ncbi:Transcriptional regulator, ArsR family [uncultured Desulfatiglans sp.]|nr:Transcriptional regulator, ArsR family [uncultured Desulfatiglans sp.]
MKRFIRVMKALSDANRVKILKILEHRQMCVCEIQAALGISQPTVSKHLKILAEADLVDCRKDGLWVNYFLAGDNANPFAEIMRGNLAHWLNEEREIAEIVTRLPHIRRENICQHGGPANHATCKKCS